MCLRYVCGWRSGLRAGPLSLSGGAVVARHAWKGPGRSPIALAGPDGPDVERRQRGGHRQFGHALEAGVRLLKMCESFQSAATGAATVITFARGGTPPASRGS